ncbi:unnamed protein product, partial [Mesorhabditis belari]|uniref:Uncharacterized protein n=1 Tax=Mesorhabditis belari TaxID=2138241 RepID=A0AAF3E821_9BILA
MRRVLVAALIALATANQRYATPSRYPTPQQKSPQTYSRLECRVDDPLSCSQVKGEVCVFSNGQYRCECPPGISRLGDGRCKMVNECSQPKLNQCHKDARCIDKSDGYTCQCNAGFADVSPDRVNKPGRQCQRTQNECGQKLTYGVDCDSSASCVDTPEGFQCVCQPGYTDISSTYSKNPGRKCVEVIDECRMGTADCSPNADCIDKPQGFDCQCRSGFVDASPDIEFNPGRVCNKPKEPEYYGYSSAPTSECYDSSTCGPNEECQLDRTGRRVCKCQAGAVKDENGRCRVYSQCERSKECDVNAQCSNAYSGVECKCPSGYLDVSPDPVRRPGRKCQQLVNECSEGTHDCDPQAECIDTQTSYICRCPSTLTDVSSRYGKQPGRKCAKSGNYCKDRSQNSCDENADCVELPDGYTCKCFDGYVDVSSNANLPPGRVCTLHTQCPTQPTDLVFLIDGSGSIGSYIFQTDVLRFISEFAELFDIGPKQTRVAVVQYSDQIRHEFGLGDYTNARSVHEAIQGIDYLTGLTRTGAAIEHVATEAFNERRGARPLSSTVARVVIVITDGRSQDNVTIPSSNARRMGIQLFAIGVTNHVLDSELETIAGSTDGFFHVNGFEDLNTRLRSLIQKVTCPKDEPEQPTYGPCDPTTHTGCDRSKNQVCLVENGRFICGCPKGFELHPVTKVCGGDPCNPEISTSCPDPEVCEKTPFGNWRCSCAEGWRDPHTGACKLLPKIEGNNDQCDPKTGCPNGVCKRAPGGDYICECLPPFVKDPKSDTCQKQGGCDPNFPCDTRKREQCLPDGKGGFSCQCPTGYERDEITGICKVNECLGENECDQNAICKDTPESYICTCRDGYEDVSTDKVHKPGRKCRQYVDECALGTHNCSVNALCIDHPIGFFCRCKDGFQDVSPDPNFKGTVCQPYINECESPSLNDCHKNATCRDTYASYTCSCNAGFVDTDELRNPGRHCKKINDICETGKHDCSSHATCVERGAHDYECVCDVGYIDMSPDPARLGRVCIEQVCLDPTKNTCHPAATCKEVATSEKYVCKCRDGWLDMNKFNPGRECKKLDNECERRDKNDCDPIATCKDLPDGYECVCPVNSKDISPDPTRPGRHCKALMDECGHPQLNNCSRFANCRDLEEGYECVCKSGYKDVDPAHPGTNCTYPINECDFANMHDCGKHATCQDLEVGYECICDPPYLDVNPANPGRICRYNECRDPKMNYCHKENADCVDTDDGFYCQCKPGFYDDSPDPLQPGTVCVAFSLEETTSVEPAVHKGTRCGSTWCNPDLGEVCLGGTECVCKKGESRESPKEKCQAIVEIPIVIHVVSKNGDTLVFTPDLASPTSTDYIEISADFNKGVGSTVKKTVYGEKFVGSDVKYIAPPKIENPDWSGFIVNGSLKLTPGVDKCKVYEAFTAQLESQGLQLSRLGVDNLDDLNPCKPPHPSVTGEPCGNGFCNADLGEFCLEGTCTCPKGMKRAGPKDKCQLVESWNLPLYVIRDHSSPIAWTTELANPSNDYRKEIVDRFITGIAEVYHKIPVGKSFVTVEVNDIEEPASRNSSWESGGLFNFTVHFARNTVETPQRVYTDLVEYIKFRNDMEIGSKKLYISPDQLDWECFHSNCGPHSICRGNGRGGYTCICLAGFDDLMPNFPGHDCVDQNGSDWCTNKTLNTCSEHARCVLTHPRYKCICDVGYIDATPADLVPGTICKPNYCADVNFCPANSTCHNYEESAQCVCKAGFVDVRKAGKEKLEEAALEHNYCLPLGNVNECILGLHDCHLDATCIDLKDGFTCKCNEGYEDLNVDNPGRACARVSRIGTECHGHGDFVTTKLANGTTSGLCVCYDGYTGEHCETEPSKAGIILALILALLFLLLTLLCCIWACARCRCFGGRGASVGTSGQELVSEYYTIPRAKLKPAYAEDFGDNAGALQAYLDDGASISSGGSLEEIERRVTTDVTTREIRTTTVTDSEGNVHTTQAEIFHNGPIDSVETEAEQFAMTSADHFTHAAAGGASRSGMHSSASRYEEDNLSYDSDAGNATVDRVNRASQQHQFDSGMERHRNEYSTTMNSREEDYATVGEMRGRGTGDGTMDRNTKFSTQHDFQPGSDPRTGVERRRNDMVTTTTSNEVNYF